MISQAELSELLSYNPETGNFTWKVARGRVRKGVIAGTPSHGYLAIRINGVLEGAHRLAWVAHYGTTPKGEVDHKNGNRADNRISNLRDVTRHINQQNQRHAQVKNICGLLGVSVRSDNRFIARIFVGGKAKHLGSFSTPEQASAAYQNAKRQYHEGNTL